MQRSRAIPSENKYFLWALRWSITLKTASRSKIEEEDEVEKEEGEAEERLRSTIKISPFLTA